jgi:phosphoglycolate phosphatase-like HAD superfamily hydrolase
MLDALHDLHPGRSFSFDGIEVSGRLDPLIYRDLAARHGIHGDEEAHAVFRATYAERLRARLAARNTERALSGAGELVRALHGLAHWAQGLLTGNYEPTGLLKVTHAGLDPAHFRINAFADHGATRRELPPVAMRRYQEATGRAVAPQRVVIIGDTPLDVDCAHHNGCRCLAVATGVHPRDELRAAGADLVVDDLSDVAGILRWLES